jgi:hypothetical protein
MRSTDEYCLDLSAEPDSLPVALAEKVLDRVWRADFHAPGFCLLDLGAQSNSHTLRSRMVTLKGRLSEIGIRRTGSPFVYRSMGRFDQQETTKFHIDGAPAESMLVLGYEPSRVRSRLFLADYSRCAFDLGMEPQQFLRDFNPMFRKGEELLRRHVTELPKAEEGHYRILLINNSSLPFTEARRNPLGVMHKAEIINPTAAERRIVNSIMLVTAAGPSSDQVSDEQLDDFVRTDKVSPRVYG